MHVRPSLDFVGEHRLLDCSDDDFEWMKEFLLLPENRLKSICFRLSGISNMLKDLSDTGHDSQVRRYLETEIKGRIEDVIPQAERAPDFSSEIVFDSWRDRAIVDISGIRIRLVDGPPPDDFSIWRPPTTDPRGKQMGTSNISCNRSDLNIESIRLSGPRNDDMTPPGNFAQLSPEADLDALFQSPLLDIALGSPA